MAIVKGDRGYEYHAFGLTPDQKSIILTRASRRNKVADVMTVPLGPDQTSQPFLEPSLSKWVPLLSPTGDALACLGTPPDSAVGDLWVVGFPVPGAAVRVSVDPSQPDHRWIGPNELAWQDASRRLWSATVTVKNGQVDVIAPNPCSTGSPSSRRSASSTSTSATIGSSSASATRIERRRTWS